MENQDEKKYFRTYKDGKICYNMIDTNSAVLCGIQRLGLTTYYKRYKQCKLEFQTKELVALNPTVDKSHGWKYTYKIVEDKTKKFHKVSRHDIYIDEDELITDTITTIKDN
jgi:hypothetical protein